MKLLIACVALAVVSTLSGCKMARCTVQDYDIAVNRGAPRDPIPVYDATSAPPQRAGTPFARIFVNGNGNADINFLKQELGEEGGRIGADFVMLEGSQVSQGPTVTSYGGGMAISDRVSMLSIWGVAYVYSPSRMGLSFAKDNALLVEDVTPDGPCGKAGIRIGEKVLAANGRRLANDPLAFKREMYTVQPGQTVKLEVADKGGNQRVVEVIAAPNE